jgi:hypothetical protein
MVVDRMTGHHRNNTMGKLTFEEVAYEKGYRQALKDSSAPELLAALHAVLPSLESIHENGAPILDRVYAAIAKAEGDK